MLEIIIAFYVSGVGLAWWQIWLPSYRTIKHLEPNNLLVRQPIVSGIVIIILFIIVLPALTVVLLFDDNKERFIKGFVKGAIQK